jgi:hypothetical protein
MFILPKFANVPDAVREPILSVPTPPEFEKLPQKAYLLSIKQKKNIKTKKHFYSTRKENT